MANTTDLSEFGYIELNEAAKLLTAYCEQSPDYLEEKIHIEFNPESGCVFLTDEDYNVGMLNGNDLEQWLNCPECGNEGFKDEMLEDANPCCLEFLKDSELITENEAFTAQISIGETSSGSLLLEDIVLGIQDLLPADLLEEFEMYDADNEDDDAERAGIFEEIIDHLNDVAPDGMHFGASGGDGASFGFWKDDDDAESQEA